MRPKIIGILTIPMLTQLIRTTISNADSFNDICQFFCLLLSLDWCTWLLTDETRHVLVKDLVWEPSLFTLCKSCKEYTGC